MISKKLWKVNWYVFLNALIILGQEPFPLEIQPKEETEPKEEFFFPIKESDSVKLEPESEEIHQNIGNEREMVKNVPLLQELLPPTLKKNNMQLPQKYGIQFWLYDKKFVFFHLPSDSFKTYGVDFLFVRNKNIWHIILGTKHLANDTSSILSSQGKLISWDSSWKQTNFLLGISYEHYFSKIFSISLDLLYGFQSSLVANSKYIEKDTTSSFSRTINFRQDGGNYFKVSLTPKVSTPISSKISISIGLEYSINYFKWQKGGDWEKMIQTTDTQNNQTSERLSGSTTLITQGIFPTHLPRIFFRVLF